MAVPSVQLCFRTRNGLNTFEVNGNATTDEIINSIATAMHVPKEKILIGLDCSLGEVCTATQANAKDIDAMVQAKFKFNIVQFIESSSCPLVYIKH